jgi:drug/metabolite transporter (DMT)-like permease
VIAAITAIAAIERRTPPLAALAVAVAAVSTSAVLVRWSAAPSSVAALYRVAFTVGLLVPLAVVRHRSDFRRLRPRDALAAGATGVALAVHFAAWFESLAWTSVAASVTLVQSQPLFVAVGGWALLGERLGRRRAAGVLVAVGGMVVMSLGDGLAGGLAGRRPLYGNALAVVGAVAAAGYVLAGRSLRQRVALVPYVTVVYAACVVALLAVVGWQGHALAGYPPREWLLFLGMAVGPGLAGHTVVNWVLARLDSAVVSVALLGEPIGATLLAAILLAEPPGAVTVLGGAVVLAGIAVTATGDGDADGDRPGGSRVDA